MINLFLCLNYLNKETALITLLFFFTDGSI